MIWRNVLKKKFSQKVFIISIPKAGTYFLSEILKNFGLNQTFLHIAPDKYENYNRASSIEEMRSNYEKFKKVKPIAKSINLIKPGEFAVGHIPFKYQDLFINFRIIFIKRNIKDVLLSYMNFLEFSNRTGVQDSTWLNEESPSKKLNIYLKMKGEPLLNQIEDMIGWNTHNNSFQLKYEKLNSLESGALMVEDLVNYLGIDITNDTYENILAKSLNSKTLTKAPSKYNKSGYWDSENDELFVKMRGAALPKLSIPPKPQKRDQQILGIG